MPTLKRMTYGLCAIVLLIWLPGMGFGASERENFFQSANDTLIALKKLQAHCQVGISYHDYVWALGEVKYEINKLDESFRRYEKVYAVYPADSEESSRRTFLMGMATHTLAEALAYYRLAEGAVKRRDQKLLSELWTTAGDRIREAERDLEESRKDLK